jgi:hypothetical protein
MYHHQNSVTVSPIQAGYTKKHQLLLNSIIKMNTHGVE